MQSRCVHRGEGPNRPFNNLSVPGSTNLYQPYQVLLRFGKPSLENTSFKTDQPLGAGGFAELTPCSEFLSMFIVVGDRPNNSLQVASRNIMSWLKVLSLAMLNLSM